MLNLIDDIIPFINHYGILRCIFLEINLLQTFYECLDGYEYRQQQRRK